MPEPNGSIVKLRAYFDPKSGRHVLEANPETLRICKSTTRVVSMLVQNETVETEHYKPVILGYQMEGGRLTKISRNPQEVFDDSPNFPGSSFVVPDDGKPCYFMVREHLGLEPREKPCGFSDDGPGKHTLVVRFSHEGWDDHAGSGEHVDWHMEC